jgi:hypothetical protein
MARLAATAWAVLFLFACTGGDDAFPIPPRTEPVAWIHDGLRLFRFDTATGGLERVLLPATSPAQVDTASDVFMDLVAGPPTDRTRRPAGSPDGRFVAYLSDSDDQVRARVFDRQAQAEFDIGIAGAETVRFLGGHPAVLAASHDGAVTFLDAATRAPIGSIPDVRRIVDLGGILWARRLADDDRPDGRIVERVTIEAGALVRRVIEHPWDILPSDFDPVPGSLADDGSVLLEATVDQDGTWLTQVVRCDLMDARCQVVAADATAFRLHPWSPQTSTPRPLARDGRSWAALPAERVTGHSITLSVDGWTAAVDHLPGTPQWTVAREEGRGAFVLTREPDAAQVAPPGVSVVRIDADGTTRTTWSGRLGRAYDLAYLDVTPDEVHALLIDVPLHPESDVMQWFVSGARSIDLETGNPSDELAGGGPPLLWDAAFRHVLVARDLGPGGLHLVDVDAVTGDVRPLLHWQPHDEGAVRVMSSGCRAGWCPLPRCFNQAPLADRASITWDDRDDAYEVDVTATVGAIDPMDDGTVRIDFDTGDGQDHHAIVNLPAPSALPISPGDVVQVLARQVPADGAAPGQVFGLWTLEGERIAYLVGGTLAAATSNVDPEDDRQVRAYVGTTECAPEPVEGCGRIRHPAIMLWDPQSGWSDSIVLHQGHPPTHGGWVLFASDEPLDGGCAALPGPRAYAFFDHTLAQ